MDEAFVPPHKLDKPWRLGLPDGKYYGTSIVTATGETVCELWLRSTDRSDARPSPREDQDDEVYDSHYENMRTYLFAKAIVDAVNHG